ncbi:MAG: recombinase RecT [Muribaculum sp.]|nr:recombinase RecT [Muribaculum sp.]
MAENNQIAQTTQAGGGLAKLKAVLNADSVKEQFQNALAENKDLFIASIIDLYNGDASLQKCNPNQIVTEALKAAVLDLPISRSLGFAYIVVYNNTKKVTDANGRTQWVKVPTPTFIPGYKGYIQLAMRTGQYKTINADYVYEGELRTVNRLSGEIALDGKRTSDKVVGYFCYFELLNGYSKTLFMSVEEMAKYAKRYSPSVKQATTVADLIKKANNGEVSKSVGWEGNFNDMALKTVIRRVLSKYGYLSIKMQNAIAADDNASQHALLTRDETLQLAEAKTIDLDASDTEFEEVIDTETGEVTQQAKSAPDAQQTAQSQTEEETPGY